MSVKNIMTTAVVTIEMDDPLSMVKEIFDKVNFHHLLVVESGILCGIVSDRDLLRAISPNIGTFLETSKDIASLKKRTHQVMTRNPITTTPEAGIFDAISIFNNHGISCLPVVDDKKRPLGIVSWRDILKAIELNQKDHSK